MTTNLPVFGRPRSFTSAKELWDKCLEYFVEWEKQKRPLTVVGLAVFLDICKDTLHEYGKGTYDTPENDFSDTVKKAKEYIECNKWEKALKGEYHHTVSIFDLKVNHGAQDKIVTESVVTGKGGEPLAAPSTVIVTEELIRDVVRKSQEEY